MRPRNVLTSYVPNWVMLRCSRLWRSHRAQRKNPKHTEVELPERNRPNRVHRTMKRRCRHRKAATARFRRLLRSRQIRLLRLDLSHLCQARAQTPVHRALPGHRPPPKSPPCRRLESLISDNPLPRAVRLPWLPRRACKAVLSARRSQHSSTEF